MKVRKKALIQNACYLKDCQNSKEGWVKEALASKTIFQNGSKWYVQTLEGVMTGKQEDVLMQGIDKELYICKKSIFDKTYDILDKDLERNVKVIF